VEPTLDARVAKKYQVQRTLGVTGRGVLYMARHLETERLVWLEVLHDDVELRSFQSEERASQRVAHRGLIDPFDVYHGPALAWLATEQLRGETLHARLERAPLELDEIQFVFAQLLEILADVHRAGIVHQHLGPQQVFLERTVSGALRVRLLDFGVITHQGRLLGSVPLAMAIATETYRAPELTRAGAAIDARADLFALGAMLNECITRRFSDPSRGTAQAPAIAPEAAPYLRIAAGCSAREPGKRMPGVAALQEAFRRASQRGGTAPTRSRSRVAASGEGAFSWLTLGVLLLVVLAFVGVFADQGLPSALPADAPEGPTTAGR